MQTYENSSMIQTMLSTKKEVIVIKKGAVLLIIDHKDLKKRNLHLNLGRRKNKRNLSGRERLTGLKYCTAWTRQILV